MTYQKLTKNTCNDKNTKNFKQPTIRSILVDIQKTLKEHGEFIKEQKEFNRYVLDVFKRNNLK